MNNKNEEIAASKDNELNATVHQYASLNSDISIKKGTKNIKALYFVRCINQAIPAIKTAKPHNIIGIDITFPFF